MLLRKVDDCISTAVYGKNYLRGSIWEICISQNTFFTWAIPRPTAECLAKFFHQHIYCRYLAPGVIIHDRGGEFCNKICGILHERYRVQVNVIAAGKPQGNGQAESMVKKMKEKMRAFMIESCSFFYSIKCTYPLMIKLFLRRKPWPSKELGRDAAAHCRAGCSRWPKHCNRIRTCWNVTRKASDISIRAWENGDWLWG